MTPTQFKIFAWFYYLLDTAIAGAATSFAIEVSKVSQGGAFDLNLAWHNAVIAAVVAGVLYLKRSPLPELIANRQGNPAEQSTLAVGLQRLQGQPGIGIQPPQAWPPPLPPMPPSPTVITELSHQGDNNEPQK